MEAGSLFSFESLVTAGGMLLSILVITIAMLFTRLVALIIMKNELFKYFYTDMHIQLGLIISTMLMYITYIEIEYPSNLP